MRLGVVLLAAGASTRMGRPKLLLPWGDSSVIGHLTGRWRALDAAQIVVVCAAGDAAMEAELDRLEFPAANRIVNPDPGRGMFSSILCAVHWPGWRPEISHWVISLGDQPHVQERTLRRLIAFGAAHPARICQPARSGKARHPVLLPARSFRRLARWADGTLRGFLELEAVLLCEVDDAGLEIDLDGPGDYARAVAFSTAADGKAQRSTS
jgi:molybdenum cofactor cytidylyltransferase